MAEENTVDRVIRVIFRGLVAYRRQYVGNEIKSVQVCLVNDNDWGHSDHIHVGRISYVHSEDGKHSTVENKLLRNDGELLELQFLDDEGKIIGTTGEDAVWESFSAKHRFRLGATFTDYVPQKEWFFPAGYKFAPIAETPEKRYVNCYMKLEHGLLAATNLARWTRDRHSELGVHQPLEFVGVMPGCYAHTHAGDLCVADECVLTIKLEQESPISAIRITGVENQEESIVIEPAPTDGAFLPPGEIVALITNYSPQRRPDPFGIHYKTCFRLLNPADAQILEQSFSYNEAWQEYKEFATHAIVPGKLPYPRIPKGHATVPQNPSTPPRLGEKVLVSSKEGAASELTGGEAIQGASTEDRPLCTPFGF